MLNFIFAAIILLVVIGIITLALWVLFAWLKLNLIISLIIFVAILVLVLIVFMPILSVLLLL